MGTQLTPKQTIVALAVGMVALLVAFYVAMIVWGGEQDLLVWSLPAILIIGVFLALPLGVILANMAGRIILLPFLAIFALVDHIKKRTSANHTPDGIRRPADGPPKPSA